MRDRSKEVSEARSLLTGRIVDTYTNILTVKLFARARDEDAYVREAVEEHTGLFYNVAAAQHAVQLLPVDAQRHAGGRHRRLAIMLWGHGKIGVGAVAMALPLSWQIITIAGWVAMRVTEIFENIGVVQEGMMTIARPIALDRQAGRRRARGAARRDRVQGHPLRLRPRERADRRAVADVAPASGSAWSAAPAPASRRWSTCCCGSSSWRTAGS